MKKPVGHRPAAWKPRQRVAAALLALVFVGAVALWWVGGAADRSAGAACGLYTAQQSDLHTALVEADEAADRADAAGDTTVIGSFDDVDREFNSLRRWQSTDIRLADALGDVGSDGADHDAARTLASVTAGVAELQRLIEDENPTSVRDWVPELQVRLQDADEFCAGI
ncbi:hypothetical protein BH09ACT12_BH09ACT12_05140 [soil metagenome]